MGARLAELAGEDPSVVAAIAGQYRPAGPSDSTVSDPVAATLVIAERADTLYGFFAAGMRPTGSKDPFALRRSALALLRTLEENGLRLPLEQLMSWAEETHGGVDLPDRECAARVVVEFVLERLSVNLREQGFRHDLISAVRGASDDSDALSIRRRVQALADFLEAGREAEDLVSAYTRVRNILDQEGVEEPDTRPDTILYQQPEESDLDQALVNAERIVVSALLDEDDNKAMSAIARLREPVDAFFDHVTVNAESEVLRGNRLRLLAYARQVMERVAAFGELEGR